MPPASSAPDRSPPEIVPRFFLYGEAGDEVAGFLHLETIAARSRLHDWRILPHRHAGLMQVLLATAGRGRARLDAAEQDFAAPALVLVPPGIVHGYAFAPNTQGWVATIAEGFVAAALGAGDPAMPALDLAEPVLMELDLAALEEHGLAARLREMERECLGAAPGRIAAVAALLRLLLIGIARLRAERSLERLPASTDAAAFARFRALVERWYREHHPVSTYARALGMTEKRLAALCRRMAGRTPAAVIHARLATEARRCLIYTSMTVAETGYALGFQDPAYFSRFFRRQTGVAPTKVLRARGSFRTERPLAAREGRS